MNHLIEKIWLCGAHLILPVSDFALSYLIVHNRQSFLVNDYLVLD